AKWQAELSKLRESVEAHLSRYGDSSNFPALDVREIERMLQDDEWTRRLRPAASLVALINFLAGCYAVGGRSNRMPRHVFARLIVMLLLIALSSVIFFCGHASLWIGGTVAVWVGLYGLLTGSILALLSSMRGTSGNWTRACGAAVCLMTPFLWWQS